MYHGFCSIECYSDYKLKQPTCTGMDGPRPINNNITIDDIFNKREINAVLRMPGDINFAIICDSKINMSAFMKCCEVFKTTVEENFSAIKIQ